VFTTRLANGTIEVTRAEPAGADMVFTSTPRGIAALTYGGVPLGEGERLGLVAIEGDRAIAERFVTLFPLPPKWTED
jgi:hypothetical protein